MASLKSKLVAIFLRLTRKRAFQSPEGLHEWIAKSRRTQSSSPPARLISRVDAQRATLNGHDLWDVRPKSPSGAPAMHVLYLHGGAYCFEITSFHWDLIVELCEQLQARIMVPIYPLAPEHRHDEIFAFGMAAYRQMADRSGSQGFAIVGDSAGANMAVVLTMMAAQDGLPLPASHVLISPGLDMTMPEAELSELAARDPWLDIPGGLEAIRLYAPDLDLSDWRISPVHGDLSILPPTLILTGTRDMLTPSAIGFAEKARAAGVDVELEVADGMIHVWPLIDMPEARIARRRIVDYLSGQTSPPTRQRASDAAE